MTKPMTQARLKSIDAAVGRRIKTLRIEQKKSMEDLARQCGISFQQIQKYEFAKNRISVSRLFQIARALDVPMEHLLVDISE